jgi:porin
MRPHPGKFTVVFAVLALSSLAMGQEADLDAEIDRVGVEYKSDYGDVSRFGGPISVGAELQAANRKKTPLFRFRWMDELLEPWFEMKKKLHADHGISFGINYNALTQWLTESEGDRFAAGGVFEFFGSWTALWRDTDHRGSLTWKLESRHRLGTDVAPQFLGFEAGIASLTGTKFGDYGFALTNFFWRQEFAGGKFVLQLGRLDATDYLDVYAMENPLAGFQNFVFTLNPTISAPNEGSLGVVAAARATEEIYVIAGFIDANGVPTQTGWDTFFSDHEYFKHVEIGWTTSQDRIYLDNVHVTLWHADERVGAAQPSGWGANLSWTTYLAGKWLPFVRAGYADDGGSLTQKSISIGFGYQPNPGKNLFGFGLNWGQPNEDTWGPGLSDQYTAEIFYRWQATKAFAITPDLQYIKNPALNPEADSIWVFGLRVRGAL